MEPPEVTIVFTKDNCRQCDMTKMLLDKEGVEYVVRDIYDESNFKMVTETLGYTGAPVVLSVLGEHWYGFRPDLIQDLSVRIHGA